jgi:hypothetical protein
VSLDTGDQALLTGMLRVTETCVFMEAGGEPMVLVWHAPRTGWKAETREITFQNRDGTAFSFRDGIQVSFGGGGDSTAEGGVSPEDWLASIDWVSAPDPDCPLEVRWFVNEVALR